MIVQMRKAYIVCRSEERSALLEALGALGVVHLQPVDPSVAVPEELRLARAHMLRARQILGSVQPAGAPPEMEPSVAVERILALQRDREEAAARLSSLQREAEKLAPWGGLRLASLAALEAGGVELRFYSVPVQLLGGIQADLVQPLAELPARRRLVAVVGRGGNPLLPEEAEPLQLPPRDIHAVRAEAAEVEAALVRSGAELAALARLGPQLAQEEARLSARHTFAAAEAGALLEERLSALQGWVPAERAQTLSDDLSRQGIQAAVELMEPDPDEQPPTLVRYPRWARPIQGLFEILGTQPGYREFDVSSFFMIALPIFAAFLIGDFGYGLVFFLLGTLLYPKLAPKVGVEKLRLLIIVGLATMVWGILAATYFSFTPDSIARVLGTDRAGLAERGGFWAGVTGLMATLAPLYRSSEQEVQTLLVQLAFLIGSVHLTLAKVRQMLFFAPDQRMYASLGWILFLWGVLGVIWWLYFDGFLLPVTLMSILLLAGAGLVILFTHPSRNPVSRLGIGLAASLLPALNAFSDTISYIRLMAVGLATLYIGDAFNTLAIQLAGAATWAAGVPLLLAGHGLNIAMAVIAVFAHGVRLNMLEFSNSAGIQWSGYPYEPFAAKHPKEI